MSAAVQAHLATSLADRGFGGQLDENLDTLLRLYRAPENEVQGEQVIQLVNNE